MKVELINIPSEVNSDSLKQYLSDVSSVVRNAQPKDNDRLFNRLLKESFGGKASRVFEFIPCKLDMTVHNHGMAMCRQFFGFWQGDGYYYTNARELLNWGWAWEEVVEVVDFTHYRAVKCTAPYFIYGQVSTHTQITSISHSNRYTESDLGYWMPHSVRAYWKARGDEFGHDYAEAYLQDYWNGVVTRYGAKDLQQYMKAKGESRREVYARGSDMLQYRVFSLGGYMHNPNAWEHFINQRLRDPHTQLETRNLTALIEEAINADRK